MIATVLAECAGFLVAAIVTARAHRADGFWAQRLGETRFRLANLPVGGILAVLAAMVFPVAALPLVCAGAAMAVTAIGYGFIDPLPVRRRWRS